MGRETFFKIVDRETGLYWGGYRRKCTDKIGTRFARWSEVENVFRAMDQYHGGWPDNWYVACVEIEEIETERFVGDELKIRRALIELPAIFMRCGLNTSAQEGRDIFERLRNNWELGDWAVIARMDSAMEYARSRAARQKMLRDVSIPDEHFQLESPRWVLFKTLGAATMAKLSDLVVFTVEIDHLRARIAAHAGVDVSKV